MPAVRNSRRTASDRRNSILEATFRLAGREGLNNITTSAVSREAGIAAGTLFLYFETKDALINALYVELVQRRFTAITAGLEEPTPDKFKTFWYTWARWYFDQPAVSQVIQQCETSFVLTPESLLIRDELDNTLRQRFFPESEDYLRVPLNRQVGYALMIGPIQVLAQLRDKGEIPITDELLNETYRRVRRALEDQP